jgi:hypothetical protein
MARIAAVAVAAAALGLAATPALASRSQLSVIEDDHLLLYSGDATREAALDQMQRLGVTTIHTVVIWRHLAPQPKSLARPAFDATDPASYGGWGPYDALVQGAQARGMQVLMTPSSPMPEWASQCGRAAARRWVCKPRPSDYGDFVRAIATRYSGSYTTGGVTLPRVSAWALWNEPNHRLWLMPHSGDRYRALATAGLAALAATGHRSDLVMIGETAPGGGSNSTAPVDFMREVFCLDSSDRPYTGGVARRHGCAHRPRFAITGISDHPYTSAAFASPSSFKGGRADAPIASIGRLVSLLDRAARYGIVPRHAPVYLTEFGFQTRPPDRFGLTLARQAEYLNEADYMAFLNPRVASVAQYELRDDPRVNVFNTGLCFKDGRPKPSLAAYALPVWLAHVGATVRVFGLVRSARGSPVSVAIQHRARGLRFFRTVARTTTNKWGYLLVRLRDLGGRWRLQVGSGAAARYSRVAA